MFYFLWAFSFHHTQSYSLKFQRQSPPPNIRKSVVTLTKNHNVKPNHNKRAPQLVNEFPALKGTPSFIAVFLSPRHLLLSWAGLIQLTTPRPLSFTFTLTSTSHRRLVFQMVSCLSDFPTEPPWISLLPHMRHMPRLSHHLRFHHPDNIWWEVCITKLLIMQYSSVSSYYFHPLRPRYLLQQLVLKHSQPKSHTHKTTHKQSGTQIWNMGLPNTWYV